MKSPALKLVDADVAEKWQQILADLITDPKELLEILELDPATLPEDRALDEFPLDEFPLKAPRPYVARIEKGNWNDPLLRQIWPSREETRIDPSLGNDPLQESRFNTRPGLLQKYSGRVLLTAAPHCAIHCRYCFRRHFDYAANSLSRQQWQASLAALRDDQSINEVILSGGDPLANSDRQLEWLLKELETIEHLDTLRIHSRLPVVIPQRISAALLSMLERSRFRLVLVAHVNHGRELDRSCADAFRKLRDVGVTLLNQSVILADVNDNLAALVELSRTLFQCHVLPYYLHLPDKVAGTGHFQLSHARARDLVEAMRKELPGYLVPTLVQEIPGEESKTPLL